MPRVDDAYIKQLDELKKRSRLLNQISSNILIVLVLNILLFLIVAFMKKFFFHVMYFIEREQLATTFLIWLFSVLSLLIELFFLNRFNSIREKGLVVYEELSDEIDWSSKRKEFIYRPSLETRIIIKEFLKASDLPLTSGPNGRIFYLILFITIFLFTILISIF